MDLSRLLPVAVPATALAAALLGGVFFAFSTFVMPALAALPPAQGVAAMQAINQAALGRWVPGTLLGTAAACLAVGAASLGGGPGAGWRGLGCALYLVGGLGVTALCNIPRNEALAGLGMGDPGLPAAWSSYLSGWTAWNHVRCAASLAAAAALLAGR